LNSARDSIYEDADYDSDKPHFIYIQEDDSVSSLQNGEQDLDERELKDGSVKSEVENCSSVSSSNNSVCSEVDNYQHKGDLQHLEAEMPSGNGEQSGGDSRVLNDSENVVNGTSDQPDHSLSQFKKNEPEVQVARPIVMIFEGTTQRFAAKTNYHKYKMVKNINS